MKLYACLILCLLVTSLNAQFGTGFKIKNFSPDVYHAHNQNWDMVQDDRGVLFFANGDGILEFNGMDWNFIPTVTGVTVLSLERSQSGKIFYGGIGEIGYLQLNKSGKWETIQLPIPPTEDTLDASYFWNIHSLDNKTYFRCNGFILKYANNEIEILEKPEFNIEASFTTGNLLWLVSDEGKLWYYNTNNNDKKIVVGTDINYTNIESIQEHRTNEVLLTFKSGKRLIYNLDKKTLNQYASMSLRGDVISHYLKHAELTIITTLNHGVLIFDENQELKFHFHENNGLSSNSVRKALVDKENILWLCTDEGISKVYLNVPFTLLLEENSLIEGITNCILETDSCLYAGTGEGVFKIFPNQSAKNIIKLDQPDFQVFDLYAGSDEIFAASPGGLYLIKENHGLMLHPNFSRALISPIGRKDLLLVGGRKELFLYAKNKNWELKYKISNFPDEVLRIEQDYSADETVFWVSMFSLGVARVTLNENNLTLSYVPYGEKQGLSNGYILPFWINDRMYFAPKMAGVYELNKENRFVQDSLFTSIYAENISSWLIKQDRSGNILVENSGPVHLLRRHDSGYEVDSSILKQLPLGYVNDIYINPFNIAWLAGDKGIARFDMNSIYKKQSILKVSFEKVTFGKDSALINGSFKEEGLPVCESQSTFNFEYKFNDLNVSFYGIHHGTEAALKFSYKLTGFDSDFSEWSEERTAKYTNLPEGKYTFEVMARNELGETSKKSSLKFVIYPPWYRTAVAYLAYFVLFVLIIYFAVRANSYRLKKSNEKLQLLVQQKTGEIEKQRDTLAEQKLELEERNKEIVDSIQYAKRLQQALLPSLDVFNTIGKEYFILYLPKDIVAGDFYWLMPAEKDNDYTFFAAADCTGHGVPGAMVSVVCHNALNRAVKEFKCNEPGTILDKVTELVIETYQTGENSEEFMDVKDGMDVALCGIKKTGEIFELLYAGANNPLWIISPRCELNIASNVTQLESNFLHEIKATKQPVGWFADRKQFETQKIILNHGDRIYVFSDGYADQFGGPRKKKFKAKKLKELLLGYEQIPLREQRKLLHQQLEEWKGDMDQIDDICIMGFGL